jgi:hypothetical protein
MIFLMRREEDPQNFRRNSRAAAHKIKLIAAERPLRGGAGRPRIKARLTSRFQLNIYVLLAVPRPAYFLELARVKRLVFARSRWRAFARHTKRQKNTLRARRSGVAFFGMPLYFPCSFFWRNSKSKARPNLKR